MRELAKRNPEPKKNLTSKNQTMKITTSAKLLQPNSSVSVSSTHFLCKAGLSLIFYFTLFFLKYFFLYPNAYLSLMLSALLPTHRTDVNASNFIRLNFQVCNSQCTKVNSHSLSLFFLHWARFTHKHRTRTIDCFVCEIE